MTCQEMRILWLVGSIGLYPLIPLGYPTNTHGIDLGSNLFRNWELVDTKAKHPKVLKEV